MYRSVLRLYVMYRTVTAFTRRLYSVWFLRESSSIVVVERSVQPQRGQWWPHLTLASL